MFFTLSSACGDHVFDRTVCSMSNAASSTLTLTERIEVQLRRKGLTWAGLAHAVGASEGAIHLWRKKGWERVRVEYAFLIADTLDFDPRLFVDRDES